MRILLTVGLLLALAPGASAASSDSLLSGYGGPGDGEQALLGQTLIRDSGGSAPAASAPAAAPAPGPEEIYETAPAAPAPATPATGEAPATAKPKPKPDAKPEPARLPPEQVQKPARPDGVTSVVGTGGSETASAIFSGRDLALLLAALIALAVLAACARRLAVTAARSA